MKKFWVGLLSILLFAGGMIFYACGKTQTSIVLSQDNVDICVNDDDGDHTAVVRATVVGISNGTVSVSSSDQDKATATVTYSKQLKTNLVTITALSPGENIKIKLTDDYGGADAYITVSAYKQIEYLAPKEEDFSQSDTLKQSRFFAVRGRDTILDANSLLTFVDENSISASGSLDNTDVRKEIVWAVKNEFADYAHIEGNTLTIDEDFPAEESFSEGKVELTARDTFSGLTTDVQLRVIDDLDASDIEMFYSYDGLAPWKEINGEEIPIVSNKGDQTGQNRYSAYIRVSVPTLENVTLLPSESMTNSDKFVCDLINVKPGLDYQEYEFGLKAADDNFVKTIRAYFQMAYTNYLYGVNTNEFIIECSPVVRKIELAENGGALSTSGQINIFTHYSTPYDPERGRMFEVQLDPNIDNLNRRYKITVDYTGISTGDNIINSETLLINYGERTGVTRALVLEPRADQNAETAKVFEGETTIASSAIYFMANPECVTSGAIRQVSITIQSLDNVRELIASTYKFNLVSSATALDFGDNQLIEKAVLLKTDGKETGVEKSFTLFGQTSVNDLGVELEGLSSESDISISQFENISTSENNVTFTLRFNVQAEALGKSIKGKYYITHANGMRSEGFDIELYLPLTGADVSFGFGNAITRTYNEGQLYKLNEEESPIAGGISGLLMRKGFSTQMTTNTNIAGGNSAVAMVAHRFLDFASDKFQDLDAFKNLTAHEIFELSQQSSESSPIASISGDYLSTFKSGYTYLVLIFTGRGDDGKECVLYRTILIESYVAPNYMSISPDDMVSVFAQDSAPDAVTSATREVILNDEKVDYLSYDNFTIVAERNVENNGVQTGFGDGTVLEFGNYQVQITGFNSTGNGLAFKITGLTTGGYQNFIDTLHISYCNPNKEGIKYEAVVIINIINADRIENVKWENANSQNELYFEVQQNVDFVDEQYLIFSTSPTAARNHSLTYIVTDENGVTSNNPVSVTTVDDATAKVKLVKNTGMYGYIFVLPSDAIYQNTISYYYDDVDGNSKRNSISIDKLYANYDYLVNNAYFLNNDEPSAKIPFGQILLRINIKVADGSSRDFAFRVYNEQQLKEIDTSKYYEIMNDVTLENFGFEELTGGIYGAKQDGLVTLTILGQTFVDVNNGEIEDLRFVGQVNGNGFVANINNGLIKNVCVDVYNDGETYKPSEVTASEEYAGAIVGQNNGAGPNRGLINVKALGVTVIGDTVGGIAGRNVGYIENARFEIYNFVKDTNVLNGKVATGGVVGELAGGQLVNVYVYDYANTANAHHIGENAGALIGKGSGDATMTMERSFAVVNVENIIANISNDDLVSGLTVKDVYSSYFEGENYTSKQVGTKSSGVWIETTDLEFLKDINGGFAYLKDFYQDLPLTNTNFTINDVSDGNFDKVLKVSDDKALIYFYDVKNKDNLDDQQKSVLTNLNTISLADLINDKTNADKLVALSSESRYLSVQGTNLLVRNVSDKELTLTLYSRYDFSTFKTFTIKIIYALSDLTYASEGEAPGLAQARTAVDLQRSKTKIITYGFVNERISLGTTSVDKYELVMPTDSNQFRVEKIEPQTNETISLTFNANVLEISSKSFAHDPTRDVQKTKVAFDVEGIGDEYELAVDNKYAHNFVVNIVDGALSLDITSGQIQISPSTSDRIIATLVTSNVNDILIPTISIGEGDEAAQLALSGDTTGNHYVFVNAGRNLIDVDINCLDNPHELESENGVYRLRFEVTLSVDQESRALIRVNQTYNVTLTSSLKIENSFNLAVTTQGLRNSSMQTNRVSRIDYGIISDEFSTYRYLYEASSNPTGVIAPGDSVIVSINVNPSFASYDYVELSYDGASALGAVELTHVFRSNTENVYYHSTDNSHSEGNKLIYQPRENERSSRLYFLVHVVDAIDKFQRDVNLNLIAKFYNQSGQVMENGTTSQVLVVSVLNKPIITINGSSDAILAKGESVEVVLQIPADTNVYLSSTMLSTNISGVSLSNWVQDENSPIGIKIFRSRLSASIKAAYKGDISDSFSIEVTIRKNDIIDTETAKVVIRLVDFRIDTNSISVKGGDDNTIIAYNGVSTTLDFDYAILPETYQFDDSEKESVEAFNDIQQKRADFSSNKNYKDVSAGYYINYQVDSDRNIVFEGESPIPLTIDKNLYYLATTDSGVQRYVPVFSERTYVEGNKSVANIGNAIFRYDEESKLLTVQGSSTKDATINMQLRTVVKIGSYFVDKMTDFTIYVRTNFNEDRPAIISNAEQFYDMQNGDSDGNAEDYILMNDIDLELHTPFDTTYIDSFDGNGFTINIKSFNVRTDRAIKMALFDNVTENTTLKNVRVNLYNLYNNSDTIEIDVSNEANRDIQIAGFAISNAGKITNCEVVSFDPHSEQKVDKTTGLVVTYTNGLHGNEVFTIGKGDGVTSFTSSVAGFVINNSGSITNSRVGGDEITLFRTTENFAGEALPFKKVVGHRQQELGDFTIKAQGDIAGFVLNNSGSIASSFVKNATIKNESASPDFDTAGFVVQNSDGARISTSYVEGLEEQTGVVSRLGGGLFSKLGIIAGFVKDNQGKINDAYSNILISNNTDGRAENEVYLASGFVYTNNGGTIENCFSASHIAQQTYTQMGFSGVDERGNLLGVGIYTNCYYYSKTENDENSEQKYSTGAVSVPDLNNYDYFYGFSFATDTDDGVWILDINEQTLTLYEPNKIALSNRYYEPSTTEVETDYTLNYTVLEDADYTYGSNLNPILIRDAKEFVEFMGASERTSIRKWYTDTQISGNYRIIGDVEMSEILSGDQTQLVSWQRAFSGKLYGNGFTISDLSIADTQELLGYGLFASIEGGSVFNLNISVNQVANGNAATVGALAGYVTNGNEAKAQLVNINVTFNENAIVRGLNFVGGVAGFVIGDARINNVVVTSPDVEANTLASVSDNQLMLDENKIAEFRREILNNATNNITALSQAKIKAIRSAMDEYGYAGGVIGYADIFTQNQKESINFNYNKLLDDYVISGLRVNERARVVGLTAGGVIGFIGPQTSLKDAGITLNAALGDSNSLIQANKYYAGGVVGQSLGALTKLFSKYSDELEAQIEGENNNGGIKNYYDTLSTTYQRGSTNIFYDKTSSYNPYAIGGLIGAVESGVLTVSYSKLNVINPYSKYAGGLIGLSNTGNARTYQIEGDENNNSILQNYLINQAYASGDVRASVAEGGATGGIIGGATLGKVTLDAVNSTNFLSLYDYENEQNYSEADLNDENFFENHHIFALAGDVIDGGIQLVNKTRIQGANQPTTGIVTSYQHRATEFKLTAANGDKGYSGTYFDMPSPSEFTSAGQGYQDTYSAFLGTSWWERENWIHASNTLYPYIRLSLAEPSYLYLDQYNIEEVLNKMRQSNIEVKVRGRVESKKPANGEYTYADVDLSEYFETHEQIEEFRGHLTRGENFVTGEQRYPSLVLNTPMFGSTGEGFRVSDLTIKYDGFDGENYGAAFVDGEIVSGSISNLTMSFDFGEADNACITLRGESVGLLATSVTNTSIYDLNIKISDKSNTFMKAEESKYVGLIAGQAIQSSQRRNMTLTRINVDRSINSPTALINAEVQEGAYVGGLFGQVRKKGEAVLDLNFFVGKFSADDNESGAHLIQASNSNGDIYIGGYVGQIDGATSIDIRESGVMANIGLELKTRGNVYAGGIFGQIRGSGELHVGSDEETSILKGNISFDKDVVIKNGYLGGFAGSVEDITLDLDSLKCDVKIDLGDKNNVNSVEVANVGGYVGYINGNFTFESKDLTLSNTINVVSQSGHVGGIVGAAYGTVEIESNLISTQGITAKLKNGAVGGVIGRVEKSGTDDTSAELSINADDTYDSSLLRYDGIIEVIDAGITDGDDTIYVGGIVGEHSTPEKAGQITSAISNTSFGGQITIGGTNGAFNVGGTVGAFVLGQGGGLNLTIQNTNNYGDVFASEDATIASLTYGGLIGQSPASINAGTISENYVLTTFNVANRADKYENKCHAVFGTQIDKSDAIETTYYNHAVCLLVDDLAEDAGYKTPYNTTESFTGGGYKTTTEKDTNGSKANKIVLADVISKAIGGELKQGHKLNPIEIASDLSQVKYCSTEADETKSNFHGITYYYVKATETHAVSVAGQIPQQTSGNIAVIGDTFTLTYQSNGISPIDTLGGKSFISGVNFEIDIKTDSPQTTDIKDGKAFGGLVNSMEGGIIYAVGVTGKLDVGTTGEVVNLGGMVGSATGGFIGESFTDVQMLYRGGANGAVGAFAAEVSGITIDHCYAVGTVETYIDAHIDGFSIGSADVRNCYTTANLEWNDYTSDKTEAPNDNISVFSGIDSITTQNNKYLAEAVPNKTALGATTGIGGISASGWTAENKFNYGYPTRQFNFLKTSSYFTRDTGSTINLTSDEKYTDGGKTYNSTKTVEMPEWFGANYNYAEANDQQKGILKAQYSRISGAGIWGNNGLATQKTPTDYFAIPNAERWRTIQFANNGKYILRNDLHADYSNSDAINIVAQSDPEKVYLDGQGHRIYDFKGTSLFETLTNSTVINLDILNAESKPSTTGGSLGILAETILQSSISNITLSGSLSNEDSLDNMPLHAGALAGYIFASKVFNTMSNVKVDIKCQMISNPDKWGRLGGIAGTVDGESYLAYCVNNGPINTLGTDNDNTADTGGIVGRIDGSTIKYSYNTTSVTNGFVWDETKDDGTGERKTGGIAGVSEGGAVIDNCYNSGMIKSGNKSVGKADNGQSYAGGIVGKNNDDAQITNCINEGPVEALGANPKFKFKLKYYDDAGQEVTDEQRIFNSYDESGDRQTDRKLIEVAHFGVDDENNTDELYDWWLNKRMNYYILEYNVKPFIILEQISSRNVYVGAVAGNWEEELNKNVTEDAKKNVNNNSEIKYNGVYKDNYKIEKEIQNLTSKATISSLGYNDIYVVMDLLPDVRIVESHEIQDFNNDSEASKSIQIDEKYDVEKDLVITSVDSLNAPRSFYIKTSRLIFNSYKQVQNQTILNSGTSWTPILNDYRSFDIPEADTYAAEVNVGSTDEIDQTIKANILAPFRNENESYETVMIAGKTFCYADDGMLSAVEGNYTATFTATIDYPYNDGATFKAFVEGNDSVSATVIGSQPINGNQTQLTITLSSPEAWDSPIENDIKITCSEDKMIEWDLKGLVYSYWESTGRIEIDLGKSENTKDLLDTLNNAENTPNDSGQYYLADLRSGDVNREGIRLSFSNGRLIYNSSVQIEANRDLQPKDFANGILTLSYTQLTDKLEITNVQIHEVTTNSFDFNYAPSTSGTLEAGEQDDGVEITNGVVRMSHSTSGNNFTYTFETNANSNTDAIAYDNHNNQLGVLSGGEWRFKSDELAALGYTARYAQELDPGGVEYYDVKNIMIISSSTAIQPVIKYDYYDNVVLSATRVSNLGSRNGHMVAKGVITLQNMPIAYFNGSSLSILGGQGGININGAVVVEPYMNAGALTLRISDPFDDSLFGDGLIYTYEYAGAEAALWRNDKVTETKSYDNLRIDLTHAYDYSITGDNADAFSIRNNSLYLNDTANSIVVNGEKVYYGRYRYSLTATMTSTKANITFLKDGYYAFTGTSTNVNGFQTAGSTINAELSGKTFSYSSVEGTTVDLSGISDESYANDHEFTFTITKTEGDVTTTYTLNNEGELLKIVSSSGLNAEKLDGPETMDGESYEWSVKLDDGTFGLGNIENGKLQWMQVLDGGETLGEAGDPIGIIEIYNIIEDKENKKLNVFVSGGDTLSVTISFAEKAKTLEGVTLPGFGESQQDKLIDITGRVEGSESWSDGADRAITDGDGNFTFDYKPNGEDEITLTYTYQTTYALRESESPETQDPLPYSGIILTHNINVGALDGDYGINSLAGIINGNDHIISYYTDKSFALIDAIAEGAAVKNLNVAGQLVGAGAIIAKGNAGTIANVSAFGNIRNAAKSASGILNENSRTINNVSNYVYINGVKTDARISGILDNNNGGNLNGKITNYGMLIGARGKDGAKGDDGEDFHVAGDDGEPGEKGGDVYAISASKLDRSDSYDNKQYIFAGDSGNGGRGGNGSAGRDYSYPSWKRNFELGNTWTSPGQDFEDRDDWTDREDEYIAEHYTESRWNQSIGQNGGAGGQITPATVDLYQGANGESDYFVKSDAAISGSDGNGGRPGFIKPATDDGNDYYYYFDVVYGKAGAGPSSDSGTINGHMLYSWKEYGSDYSILHGILAPYNGFVRPNDLTNYNYDNLMKNMKLAAVGNMYGKECIKPTA